MQSDFSDASTINESASAAYGMLRILSNEDRLFILCQLFQGDRHVGGLKELLGTQQLTVLRTGGLVTTQRKVQV